MEFLDKHPIELFHGLKVWAQCRECHHYTRLFWGYYCGCGHNGYGSCRCKAVVISRHHASTPFRTSLASRAA